MCNLGFMWRRGTRVLALACLLAILAVGCSTAPTTGLHGPGTVIDRFTLGDPWPCADQVAPTDCDEFIRIGTDTLTANGLDPDSIVDHHIYSEALQPGSAPGGPGVAVVVFDLADGSQVAAGASCGVGQCQAVKR